MCVLTPDRPDLKRWGFETVEQIQRELYLPDRRLYGEEAKPGEAAKNPCFTWSVGVMVQALNGAAARDRKYLPVLQRYIEATRSYWNDKGPVPGYDVLPGPKPIDRYYDDNEWMVLALAKASSLLHSKQILQYAKDTFVYVMSGSDDKLGGGIYWHETDKKSKNTCSNGPAAASALALYDATHEVRYLEIAKSLYAWTREHLRDPSDGLYWDNMGLNGHIGTWKFTYNTGLMLRSAAQLYSITKDESYADDVREMQASSLKHWTDAQGSFTDDVKFTQLIIENWLLAFKLVPNTQDPREIIRVGLTRMHDISRDSLGHYGNKCNDVPKAGGYSPFKLIDQAAAAVSFFAGS